VEINYSVRHYARPFLKPLSTAHGVWMVREGFIIKAECEEWVNYSEVAPIPEFGTETLEAAENFLCSMMGGSDSINNPKWLAAHPACAFGISCASRRPPKVKNSCDYRVAALLPSGPKALDLVQSKIEEGYTTLKWKIGVYAAAEEQAWFSELAGQLGSKCKLRLDANGGLDEHLLRKWIHFLEPYRDQIDFFEQPMAVGNEQIMAEIMMDSGIPIALDESLNGPDGVQWLDPEKWEGPFVVKALLMGDWGQLLRKLDAVSERVVFSSVFETGIGLENAFSLTDQLCRVNKDLAETLMPFGYDMFSLFDDNLQPLSSGPVIKGVERLKIEGESLWNQLDPSY